MKQPNYAKTASGEVLICFRGYKICCSLLETERDTFSDFYDVSVKYITQNWLNGGGGILSEHEFCQINDFT